MEETTQQKNVLDEIVDSQEQSGTVQLFFIDLPIFRKDKKTFIRGKCFLGYEDLVDDLTNICYRQLDLKSSKLQIENIIQKKIMNLGYQSDFVRVEFIDLETLIYEYGKIVSVLFK